MSIRKAKGQTAHAKMRIGERAGMSGRTAERFLKEASRKGLPPAAFGLGTPFGEFLMAKSARKRVKVYKGMVVIFNKTSDRAITCYRIPEEFEGEYEEVVKTHLGGIK